MKHKNEMIRWANSLDGTKVWNKPLGQKGWNCNDNPQWTITTIYIVDDGYAELRKAQLDGKSIQIDNFGNEEWATLTCPDFSQPVRMYRIKPTKKLYFFYEVSQDYYDDFIIYKDVLWATTKEEALEETKNRYNSASIEKFKEISKEDFDVLRRYL